MKIDNSQTLYEYYSNKIPVYVRNSSIGDGQDNFNQILHYPHRQIKTECNPIERPLLIVE